jgi:tetratricopeptide (TPR) repeat protein
VTEQDFDRAVAAGRAALGENRPERAEALARDALETLGEDARLRSILGAARLARGDARGAAADFRLAQKWGGDDADLYYAMGVALRAAGNPEEALRCWRESLARDPGHADAATNATLGALQAGRWAEACALADAAIAHGVVDPRLPLWQGHALAKLHRDAEAAIAYRRAVELAPGDAEAWFALALTLRDLRCFDAARAALVRVLEIAPEHADAGFEAAQIALMEGRWKDGFSLWDGRLRRRSALLPDDLPGRPWDGTPCPGETLLLQAEQGLGDTLQFLRYVPLAAERAGRIVLRAHPPLVRLLSRTEWPWRVIGLTDAAEADRHAPLLSLPRMMGVYSPCAEGAAYLASAFPRGAAHRRPRVALVWAGNRVHYNDSRRSCRLADFVRLRQVDGIDFRHFQIDADAAEVRNLWPELADATQGLADCLDTAQRLRECDLAISVDTALAHLAGAMDLPAWVLVPFVADWRWGGSGETTPWYPRARVWRQRTAGDWAELLGRVAAALAAWRDAMTSP